MFSREDVSTFINQHFEPAWEMVRPVPIVRIDFGNGNVSTRTLHGNVASYVCGADGQVVDILPGIYTPAAYTTALARPRDLTAGMRLLDAERRLATLREYHQGAAQILRFAMQPRPNGNQIPQNPMPDVGKGRVELRVERVVAPPQLNQFAPAPRPRTAAELANWQPLIADTRLNESTRRLLIHDRLAAVGAVQPEQIKRWLYRDVLHADLDDPNLGLGDDFFAEIER